MDNAKCMQMLRKYGLTFIRPLAGRLRRIIMYSVFTGIWHILWQRPSPMQSQQTDMQLHRQKDRRTDRSRGGGLSPIF